MLRVIITGTSNGIGRETALKFLENGFFVYGIDTEPSSIEDGSYCHFRQDVRGQLPDLPNAEYVVNNAGTIDEDDAIEVNLVGYINVAQKYCFQSNLKSLVNVGSISGRVGLDTLRYCASQGGRIAITKHLAIRLGNAYKATVNCVSFGAVMSTLEPQLYSMQDKVDQVANENLLKKWITPKEAADWIFFVAVNNRSMTGQDILIDNGEEANYNFVHV